MFRIKRHFALLALLLASVVAAYGDAPGSVTDFASSAAINAPKAAVLIVDLKTGNVIGEHNADRPLIPASIMKAVTTATLLDKTGPQFEYITPVYITGKLEGDRLDGNLLIEASGDPTINSSHDPGSTDFVAEIVGAVADLGIKTITGRIIIDEGKFPGAAVNPTWQSGDLPHYYGTGTHGFNFQDNASGKNSVKDPAGVFAARLRSALSAAGISVGNEEVKCHGKKLIGQHRSATIDEIMRSCMMRSDNQYAESMLRLVGLEYGGEGSVAEGAKEELKYWKNRRAALDSVAIYDGSGLSRSNRVTARFMGDVLRHMAKNPYYASFFPLAGQEGTLKKFLAGTSLEGYIAMKTGSMKGIQCYAGYKLDDDYVPTHLVVVMLNDMADRAKARAEVEKMLLRIFE